MINEIAQLSSGKPGVLEFVFPVTGDSVRTLEVGGKLWFVGTDLAKVLNYRDGHTALRSVRDRNKGTQKVCTPSGQQECICVNEPGLYQLIMASQSDKAEVFQDWVTDEVLPSIRKTGSYAVIQLSPARRLLAMAQQLVDHEDQIAALAVHADEVNEHLRVNDARLDSIEHNAGTYTVLAYAKLQNIVVGSGAAARLGKLATRLFRERTGLEPAQVRDERYGLVNLYPENLLREVFDQ